MKDVESPLRILLVNDYGILQGGVEVHLKFLKQALQARGHSVRLFASSASAGESSIADDQCFGTTSGLRTLLQSANPWAAWGLRRVLEEFRPDVVHLNLFLTQLSPLVLPVLRSVPCVYQAHWQRCICPKGTRLLPDGSPCRKPWGHACLREGCLPFHDWVPLMIQMNCFQRWRSSMNRIVANSDFLGQRLKESGIGGVEVVYHGVSERPARPPLEHPPGIAFAGRLVREKGVDVLLRAFRLVLDRIPAARLQIAGEGPEEGPLRALARELHLGGAVAFHGQLAQQELERRLASAWVQAVPSVWEEPFGTIAVEAAMRGTAAVVSDTGGLSEILIEGETGLRIPPGDAEALAAALSRLLFDRALAEEMGRKARLSAQQRFSFDRYLDRFCAIYHELVNGGPKRLSATV